MPTNIKMLALAICVITLWSVARADGPGTQPPRQTPDAVVVAAQLARVLPEVTFDGVGFSDVADFLRDVTGVNLLIDWKRLEKAGIDRNAPITAKLRNVKFSDALQAVCDSAGKGKAVYSVAGGIVMVSTKEGVETMTAGINADTSKWDEKTKTLMNRKLPEVTFDGVGLSDVIDFMRDVGGAKISVDWNALAKINVDRNAPVTAKLRNVPFGTALHVILDSVADKPIQITNDNGILRVAPAPAEKKADDEVKK